VGDDLSTGIEEAAHVVLFDLREPGAAERLHRERAAWAEAGDLEALDVNHYVLIVRPGLPRRLAA
jgi:hypothetical protein